MKLHQNKDLIINFKSIKKVINKYHAKKTKVNGITFDSIKESRRYIDLKYMQKSGLISNLKLQPHFLLQIPFTCAGKKYSKIEYIADFAYTDVKMLKTVVEDVKGIKTDVYMLKKKMFLKLYGNRLIFKEV